jgi:hypothetical protein
VSAARLTCAAAKETRLPLHLRVGLEGGELGCVVAGNLGLVRCTTASANASATTSSVQRSLHKQAALRTNTKLGQRFVHVERFLRLIDEVNVVGLTTGKEVQKV